MTQIAQAVTVDDLNRMQSRIMARRMLLMGFVTRIVMIETGMTGKQIRKICRSLKEEGYEVSANRTTGRLRSGVTLINSQASKLQASVVMSHYKSAAKSCGENIIQSVSIPVLERAFRKYREGCNEVFEKLQTRVDGRLANLMSAELTISDAWCLASELRSDEAYFETCPKCKIEYFTSVHQTKAFECPYC